MKHGCLEKGLQYSTTINYVCKESREKIFHLLGTTTGYCPIRVTETLAIGEANRTVLQMKLDNIIVKNDSPVAICSIMGKIVAHKQISNMVDDINSTVRLLF